MIVFKQGRAFSCRLLTALILITIFPVLNYAQVLTASALDLLSPNNEFKEIKLGADIALIQNFKLGFLDGDKSPDADSCFKFEYNVGKTLTLNNGVGVNLVGLRAYRNKVINVYLFFYREDGYKMLHEFVHFYGKYTNRPTDFDYEWKSDMVNISLLYRPVTDLGVAIFTYNKLEDGPALLREKAKRRIELALVSTDSF